MPTVTFTWNTIGPNSCKKCLALADYTWQFIDELPPVLFHPNFGVVYDVALDQSRAHGQGVHNCHCFVAVEIDDSDLTLDLDMAIDHVGALNNTLETSLSSINQFISLLRRT